MNPTQHLWKRLEARIALAIATAKAAGQSAASSANRTQLKNVGAVGPAATITFESGPFVSRTGRVRVSGFGFVIGGTLVATDVVTWTITRDGVGVAEAISMQTAAYTGSPASGLPISLICDSTSVAGSSHTWGIQAAQGAHTIQFASSSVLVEVQELP